MRLALLALPLAAVLAAGCGSEAGDAASSATAAKTNATSAPPPTSSTKKDTMPIVTVDDMGPYIDGKRSSLKDQPGKDRLRSIVQGLPINGKEVTLTVLKGAKVSDVSAVIHELGLAGAPTVRVSASDVRKDVPKELVIVPLSKLTDKPAPCSITAMVGKDMATAVWSIKGGIGKKHDKGLAGPDLGHTGESLKKELKKCESSIAFFASEPTLIWELAHSIGGTIVVNDEEKKIKTLVFLEEAPVPGREVNVTPAP